MIQDKKLKFYNEIDLIVKVIGNNVKFVKKHQKDFAEFLNSLGILFYNMKKYPKAKAYFGIASELGNSCAYKNYLCINLQ